MTELHHSSILNHRSIDTATTPAGKNKGDRSEQKNISQGLSGTVNISFNAQLRLQAYQEHKVSQMDQNDLLQDTTQEMQADVSHRFSGHAYAQKITYMLSEVEDDVQSSESGYQYLLNMLNNHADTVDNPQKLQELMRKENFFLTRRKPFMNTSDYQSYSQVLGQFKNIVDRQQFSSSGLL